MTNNDPFALQFHQARCIQCGACADSCPFGALQFDAYPTIVRDSCRLCGRCVQVCPADALTLQADSRPLSRPAETETHGIWVLAETENGRLAPVTHELLGEATALSRTLHQEVEAVLAGNAVGPLAEELAAYGATRIHLLESEALAASIEENHARAIAALVRERHPEILLVGATPKGRGLAARLAALLHTGLTADCTRLAIDPRSALLQQIRPAFGGNLMATITTPHHRPQMASVRPGVMQALTADYTRRGTVIRHDLSGFRADGRIRLVRETPEETAGDSLSDSRIIIGIGRGVRHRDTVEQIRRWARQIGAVVAGSRAAVEAGLIAPQMQIGQTGHTVSPALYIAIGISGQIQHTAAIGGARTILAINPDRSAPIFRLADYGWAAPIEAVLPRLMERLPR